MSDTSVEKKIVFEDDLTMFDPARRAGAVLDHVLDTRPKSVERIHKRVSIKEARRDRPIIDRDTGRTMSRVLFVTSDTRALEKGSSVQNHYMSLSSVFDEVHVLVLGGSTHARQEHRISQAAWVYSAPSAQWWLAPWRARQAALDMLVFSDTVRPDVVVGTDPYTAGLSAYLIASAFSRPLQIQVHEDFLAPTFKQADAHYKRKQRLARYVLRRTNSVRTATEVLAQTINGKFKRIVDVATLPQYFDLQGLREAVPTFDVHERYKDFKFVILTYAPLTADSHLHAVITALRGLLMSPRIGLIVIGTGPAKHLFQEKVKLIGIAKSVVFLERVEDTVSLLKTADLLIEAGATEEAEEHVLKAAAAGLPIVTAAVGRVETLFTDGSSAFICPVGDIDCLSKKTNQFLNQSSYRSLFAHTASEIVAARIDEDPVNYYRSYRDTIESIIVPTDQAETSTSPQAALVNDKPPSAPADAPIAPTAPRAA
ncbi:glycosyltransferase [Candidatus Nomurabacteria bacterium]|nr:glycosyltransferase [Candidatus Nomurabacteria bacterium]